MTSLYLKLIAFAPLHLLMYIFYEKKKRASVILCLCQTAFAISLKCQINFSGSNNSFLEGPFFSSKFVA